MATYKTVNGVRLRTIISSGSSSSLGKTSVWGNASVIVESNTNTEDVKLHLRLLVTASAQEYDEHILPATRGQGYSRHFSTHTVIVNKATYPITTYVVVQAAVTRPSQSPATWTDIASAAVTVPALSISHYDFYNDEAMTNLYKRIDVYEAQYLTVPSAIPSVAMSEWVDSNGTTYQFGAQVQNTSMQTVTHRFRPVFLAPDIKAKVKVSGEWVDGDIKCKVNGEWVDADAVYVKVGGEWVEIS